MNSYGPHAGGQLYLPDIDVCDEIPLWPAVVIVTSKAKASAVINTLRKHPYEVVPASQSEAVDVIEDKPEWLAMMRLYKEIGSASI